MRFAYTAKKNDGSIYSAVFECQSKSELFSELEKMKATLLSYKEIGAKGASLGERFNGIFNRIKMIDKIIFARNLGNMLEAGLSFTRALAVMEKQTKNTKLKTVFNSITIDISAGKTFHEALQKFPKVFPPIFIFMIKAGEESGNLAEALKTVAGQMEKTYQLQKKVRGAMVYPAVIILSLIHI